MTKPPTQILANYLLNEMRYLSNKHKIPVEKCVDAVGGQLLVDVAMLESAELMNHGEAKKLLFETFDVCYKK